MHRLNILPEIKQAWQTLDTLALIALIVGSILLMVSIIASLDQRWLNVVAVSLMLVGYLRLADTYNKTYRRKYPKPTGNNGLFGD